MTRLADRIHARLSQWQGDMEATRIAETLRELAEPGEHLELADVEALFAQFSGSAPRDEDKAALLAALQEPLRLPDDRRSAARVLGDLALRAREADGRITAEELRSAETALCAAGLSADEARAALVVNLGVHRFPERLRGMDLDTLAYVRSRFGDLSSHLRTCERILQARVAGAMLMDADFDGRLSGADLVATPQADGRVALEPLGDRRATDTRLRAEMVAACHEMGRAKHAFSLIRDHHANPAFFSVRPEDGTFVLRAGVRASQALNDIFQNPRAYGFECATAMVIVYYRAMQRLLGDEDFDRVCADLVIGPWQQENHLERSHIRGPRAAELGPADYTYIRNHDVSPEGRAGGWQGENVIYLGDGLYYGHPFGVASADTIVQHLNDFRRSGATRSASRELVRGHLEVSILDNDKMPNDPHFAEGALALREARHADAVHAFRRCVEAQPTDGRGWLMLAQSLERARAAGTLEVDRAEILEALGRAVDFGAVTARSLSADVDPALQPRAAAPPVPTLRLARDLRAAVDEHDFKRARLLVESVGLGLQERPPAFSTAETVELARELLHAAEVAEAHAEWSVLDMVLAVLKGIFTLGIATIFDLLRAEERERMKRFAHALGPHMERVFALDDTLQVLERSRRLPPSLTRTLAYQMRFGDQGGDLASRLVVAGRLVNDNGDALVFGPSGTFTLGDVTGRFSVDPDNGRITLSFPDGRQHRGRVDHTGGLNLDGLGNFRDP